MDECQMVRKGALTFRYGAMMFATYNFRVLAKPSEPHFLDRLAVMKLDPSDFEESFARSSGPGGQHVNKTSTAVTLKHAPSGLAVTVQDTRSQMRNRTLAWERLIERIALMRVRLREAAKEEREKLRRQKRSRPKGVQRRIVESKRRRGETKKLRGKIQDS